jgi:hypothetical protein
VDGCNDFNLSVKICDFVRRKNLENVCLTKVFRFAFSPNPNAGAQLVMGSLLPPAVGFAVSSTQVLTTGLISPVSWAGTIVPGAEYYCDAQGRLVQGRFYGFGAGIANPPLVLDNGNVFLQKIGVGVSQDQILLAL